jgi:hypothetical protein
VAGIILAGLISLYLAGAAVIYIAMLLPPERFGAILSVVPMSVAAIFPFQRMWILARSGKLAVGDPAPDFVLPAVDHSHTVQLSAEWRERPVVLIFGSYT